MKIVVHILTCLAISVSSLSASGYMKLPDIEGESLRNRYEDWIEISGLTWDVQREDITESSRSRAATRSTITPIFTVKEFDRSSPYIMLATLQGKTFNQVEIHFTKDSSEGSFTYLKYTLSNVTVSSYGISANADQTPSESFSLNFEKIKVVYTEQADDHSEGDEHEIEYDVVAGK